MYINAYMWNLEKMTQMAFFSKQNYRFRCKEQIYRHKVGKRGSGMNWEIGLTCIHY